MYFWDTKISISNERSQKFIQLLKMRLLILKQFEKKKRIQTDHKQLYNFRFLKKHKGYFFAMTILQYLWTLTLFLNNFSLTLVNDSKKIIKSFSLIEKLTEKKVPSFGTSLEIFLPLCYLKKK
ncbi:hypothetical protein BpHYR1_013729 [Brachionus plicatilis]|uniref:Transmembrane protein n=1 Tax=Brachionus plicatilis TaxID=10195 RepID=A0A3M7PA69_BRAPC|nr:hypothetical protein BpHYR1_013729 [Brachionus plicatilis]